MTTDPLRAFANEAYAFTDVAELTRAARAAAANYGITAVSANLICAPGYDRRPDMLIGDDRWREWAPRYRREDMATDDPALQMSRETTRPFTWSQARLRYRSARSDHVLDACRETTGFVDAVVVPVRDADGALLTTTFLSPSGDLDPAMICAFHTAGVFYAARGREIITGFALDPVTPLSPRETTCLEWVWRGKGDYEIGLILGISPRTVHNQIESAKAKLGVSKRSLAASEAWRRGWIH